jgi:hypothetical protein
MYVAAQRVRSPGGASGINAFLFLHGDQEIPDSSWACPDVDVIAEHAPGTLVVQRVEQPSGGNDILSYLDVAAPDAIGVERLVRILRESPPPLGNTFAWSIEAVSIRFVAQPADDLAAEFEELRKHVVLLTDPDRAGSGSNLHASVPLLARDLPGGMIGNLRIAATTMRGVEILAQDVPGIGVVYRLGADWIALLLESGVLTAAATVHVAYEDREALQRLWGHDEYHAEIAVALTGIPRESLSLLGGYRVEHRPARPPISVADASIPAQIEGYWIQPQSASAAPSGWPTGALLRTSDGTRALDLVFIERAWFPLSDAGLYSYPHTIGLQGGERWRFLRKGSDEAFEVELGPSLTRDEVAERYGPEAASRSRADHKTVQLLLRPLPR